MTSRYDEFADMDRLAEELGLGGEAREKLSAHWDESQAAFDASALGFLDREFIRAQCEAIGMRKDVREALAKAVGLFEEVPALVRLAWHCRHVLTTYSADEAQSVSYGWPALDAALHERVILFYALVLVSAAPHVFAMHGRLGIPKDVTADTLCDVQTWMLHHLRNTGQYGFVKIGWLSNHLTGKLCKLGRLQFEMCTYPYDFRAWRHADSRVVVLAPDGMKFRADGQVDGANGIHDPEPWTATLTESDDAVRGYAIDPCGFAKPDVVELPTGEWRPVLTRGDQTLGVHIPGTGKMDFDACGESFGRATPFFARHFPDFHPRAFTCTSWLLDAQLEGYLARETNIVRFLKEWYLVPQPGAKDVQTLERAFETRNVDPATAPRDTSLRRALIAHIEAGGRWRDAHALIFPEDLDWGAQVYRRGKALA